MLRRALLLACLGLAAAPAAHAADPIMPLSELRPGTTCTVLSVLRGTAISSFDAEVLDVIAPEVGLSGPRILVRVSGPAIAGTGIGPGFSGSPLICGGRNAGAISEGLGEYGNEVALATPIEEMLRDRPVGPAAARRDPALLRAARPLATPLTVSGLSGRTLALLSKAARRGGRPLLAGPSGPAGGFAPAPLVPGAAMGVSISTGDLALGAVGTVTYRDGDRLWALGHPLEGVGRRSLFMSDAYVFGIIDNPLGVADFGAVTYKLASVAGAHVQGRVTNDTVASVAGSVGAGPRGIPLTVLARDRSGASVRLDSLLADERSLGYGSGLGLVAPLGVSQAVERLMRDYGPATLRLCARFRVRQLRRPIGFCNPYFSVEAALGDVGEAAGLVDDFDLAPLTIEAAEVSVRARDGVTSDVLVGVRGPRRVTAGERIRARLSIQRRGGGRRTIAVAVRVPRSLRPGSHQVTFTGNGGSLSFEEELLIELESELGEEFILDGGGGSEPRSVRELAAAVRSLRRPSGIEARFRRRPAQLVRRSSEVSFEGRVRLRLRVAEPRRARR